MKHEIKHDDSVNKTTVTNITTIEITSPNQAHEILTMANKKEVQQLLNQMIIHQDHIQFS